MNNLWAIASAEEVYVEVKIDAHTSYIPLFRTANRAEEYIREQHFSDGFAPRSFEFEPYDYLCQITQEFGHTYYLKIVD